MLLNPMLPVSGFDPPMSHRRSVTSAARISGYLEAESILAVNQNSWQFSYKVIYRHTAEAVRSLRLRGRTAPRLVLRGPHVFGSAAGVVYAGGRVRVMIRPHREHHLSYEPCMESGRKWATFAHLPPTCAPAVRNPRDSGHFRAVSGLEMGRQGVGIGPEAARHNSCSISGRIRPTCGPDVGYNTLQYARRRWIPWPAAANSPVLGHSVVTSGQFLTRNGPRLGPDFAAFGLHFFRWPALWRGPCSGGRNGRWSDLQRSWNGCWRIHCHCVAATG